jgi:GDP-L-fucose synthase
MRVLVTGGSGMVGRALHDLVYGENNENLYENLYENEKNDNEWIFIGSKECDLTNRTDVLKMFQELKPTHVVHLAANVGGLYKNMRENTNMFTTNVRMNENVLEACHKNNINKSIFVLSSCIYPHTPSKFPMDENMIHESEPHHTNEGYAYAKRMLHLQCKNYNKEFGRQYICLVPVNMYGPHDNYNLQDAHVVPAVIHKIYNAMKSNTDYTMYGTGSPLRQFMYVYDFASIIVKVLVSDTSNDVIVCPAEETTIENMIRTIIKIYGYEGDIKRDITKSDGCMKKTIHSDKLSHLCPDLKETSLDEGLRKTIKWFIENYENCRK